MLLSLGKREPPQDLVALLLKCHARIRTFLHVAEQLGQRLDLPHSEVAEESQRCQRYFSEAFPLHVEDEEASVIPRLRAAGGELGAALDRLHEQHEQHDIPLATLLSLLRKVASQPADRDARTDLRHVAALLREELEEHLRLEEALVFPAVRALFTKQMAAQALHELRARRAAPVSRT